MIFDNITYTLKVKSVNNKVIETQNLDDNLEYK